jgi:hypothetical protein
MAVRRGCGLLAALVFLCAESVFAARPANLPPPGDPFVDPYNDPYNPLVSPLSYRPRTNLKWRVAICPFQHPYGCQLCVVHTHGNSSCSVHEEMGSTVDAVSRYRGLYVFDWACDAIW